MGSVNVLGIEWQGRERFVVIQFTIMLLRKALWFSIGQEAYKIAPSLQSFPEVWTDFQYKTKDYFVYSDH